jgi:hypothetical protein
MHIVFGHKLDTGRRGTRLRVPLVINKLIDIANKNSTLIKKIALTKLITTIKIFKTLYFLSRALF